MRIEFLPEGSEDCPLIRLFEFDADEAQLFLAVLDQLVTGGTHRVDLDELPWASPVSECRLVLLRSSRDAGVFPTAGTNEFVCELTPEGWAGVRDLAEPFRSPSSGHFQWLDETGPISLLLSPNGLW